MIQKYLFLALFLHVSLFGGSITVAVAANVSYAIQSIQNEFTKLYPTTKLRIVLGSSGKLTAQIKNGAPYDVFMSANMKYPNALYREKLTTESAYVYAKGSLAILSVKKRDFSKGIAIVLDEEIHKIALANPKTAPYGIATYEALRDANLFEKIKNKVVYGESIGQTLSYTISATSLGFVATSALYSKRLSQYKKGTHWIEVERFFIYSDRTRYSHFKSSQR